MVNRTSQAGCLSDAEQLHVEDQRRIRRNDAARATGAIAHRWRDDQPPLPADAHPGDARIPTLDDAPAAQREREGLATVARAIESRL